MQRRHLAASVAALVMFGAACDPAAPPVTPPAADADPVVFPPMGEIPEGVVQVGSFSITCYAIHGRTASGERTSMDVVAADTSVFPMRSRIYIDGVGWRTVLDRGSAIKGFKLDIWLPTKDDCRKWGRQERLVYQPAPESVAAS